MNLSNEMEFNSATTDAFENRLAGVHERINTFAIRETKGSAEISLPDKNIRNTIAWLETAQHALYEKYRRELAAEVSRDGAQTVDEAEEILKRLLRLVQTASNPKLVDDSYVTTPGKLNSLDEIMATKSSSETQNHYLDGLHGKRRHDCPPVRHHETGADAWETDDLGPQQGRAALYSRP